jgi:hypothetical protein
MEATNPRITDKLAMHMDQVVHAPALREMSRNIKSILESIFSEKRGR